MNEYNFWQDSIEYNLLTVTYPDTVTEVYTYTMSWTTTGVKTVVYEDATKVKLLTVTITK